MSANLGASVRIARAANGARQQDIADAVGVTPSYLSLVESGKRMPSPEMLERIADAFGIAKSQLLLLADPMARDAEVGRVVRMLMAFRRGDS